MDRTYAGHKLGVDCYDDGTDLAHVLEVFRLDLLAGVILELQDQVDRIDAVDLKVLIELRFHRDLLRFDLEQLDQQGFDMFEDFVLAGHDGRHWHHDKSEEPTAALTSLMRK